MKSLRSFESVQETAGSSTNRWAAPNQADVEVEFGHQAGRSRSDQFSG